MTIEECEMYELIRRLGGFDEETEPAQTIKDILKELENDC